MLDRWTGLLLLAATTACSSATPAEDVRLRSDAIIAGTESPASQDAVVLLLHESAGHQTCTATMVAPNLLVTARHCVGARGAGGEVTDWDAPDLLVYVGSRAFAQVRETKAPPAARGRQLVVPSSSRLYPDVAFVVLDRPLTTPLATVRLDGGATVGERLDVVGYGLDESGERPAVRMQRRGLEVYALGPGRSRIGEPLARGELVFGEAACSGDSGGPAFSSETGALVGIASRVGNGTLPDAAAPAAFCMGGRADDIYTDLTPVDALTARAFAAAGAVPRIERRGASPPEGELASAVVSEDAAADDAPSGEGAGCRASRGRAERGTIALVAIAIAMVRLLDRRQTSSSRSRA